MLDFLSGRVELHDALTMPQVPHEDFSVDTATVKGLRLVARPRQRRLVRMLFKLLNKLLFLWRCEVPQVDIPCGGACENQVFVAFVCIR